MSEKLMNLHLSGSSEVGGGQYDEVRMSGGSHVRGDMECSCLHASGSSHIFGQLNCHGAVHGSGATHLQGDVQASELHLSGSGHVSGHVHCQDLVVLSGSSQIEQSMECTRFSASGSSHIQGDLRGQTMRASGSCRVDGAVHMDKVELSGAATIQGGVECEEFKGSGSLDIGGLLNAGSVEIDLTDGGKCALHEIGGDRVHIAPKATLKWPGLFKRSGRLSASVIEATDIYLENTTAQTVRGARVKIGPNCRIDRVEYSETFALDPASKILQPPVKL